MESNIGFLQDDDSTWSWEADLDNNWAIYSLNDTTEQRYKAVTWISGSNTRLVLDASQREYLEDIAYAANFKVEYTQAEAE